MSYRERESLENALHAWRIKLFLRHFETHPQWLTLIWSTKMRHSAAVIS